MNIKGISINSIKFKLVISLVGLFVFSAMVAAVSLSIFHYKQEIRHIRITYIKQMVPLSYSIAAALEFEDTRVINESIQFLENDRDLISIVLKDRSGKVIVNKTFDRPDKIMADKSSMISISVPVLNDVKMEIGILEAVVTIVNMRADIIKDVIRDSLLILIFMMLISFLLSILAGRFIEPIIKLKKSIEDMSKQGFMGRVEVSTKDEIGELAASFNDMSESLEKTTVSRDELFAEVLERKLAEDKLQNILDSTPDIIMMIDSEGKITYINKTIPPYKPEDMIGKSTLEFFAEQYIEKQRQAIKQVFEKSEKVQFEHITSDGRYWDQRIVPMKAEGHVEGAMVVATDISERKIMEKERDIMLRQLIQSEKLASVGEIAAGIAHEINTPLNVILGYQELLVRKITDNPKLKRYVSISIEEVEHCRVLIRDFMLYARPADALSMQYKKFNIKGTINDALKLLTVHKSTSIKVKTDIDDGITSLRGDQKHLVHVFINLINNAIQAMPEGGVLSILVKKLEYSSITKKRNVVEFRISDTGIGISEENIDKVFDPFFTTKRPGKGTGLGLSICMRIIKDMGGMLRVESKVGEGSTFIGELPV